MATAAATAATLAVTRTPSALAFAAAVGTQPREPHLKTETARELDQCALHIIRYAAAPPLPLVVELGPGPYTRAAKTASYGIKRKS